MFSKIISSKLSLVIFILIIAYLSYITTDAYLQKKTTDDKLAFLKAEIEEMQARKLELKKNEDYYSSQDFLEKEARRLLNYQKPDEEVIAVIPNKNALPVEEPKIKNKQPPKRLEELTNPQKWWHYFFK